MNTFVLGTDTNGLSIDSFLKQAQVDSLQVRDEQGNIVAMVLSLADHQAWTHAEANLDLDRHREDVQRALSRTGGVTTATLLQQAETAAKQSDAPT